MNEGCNHPWSICTENGPFCQACGLPWHLALKEQRAADKIERLTAALKLIAGHKDKTIFSMEPEYRAGANAAYNQMAEIAIDTLADSEGEYGAKK